MDAAHQYAAILETLRQARRHPELYLGPSTIHRRSDDDADFAERAAIADLAVRLRLSETTVRLQAVRASDLRSSTPKIWSWFREGDISVGNAAAVAELIPTLPAELREEFDEKLLTWARELRTPRFRERARRLREQLDPIPLGECHQRARRHRRVWFEPARDGMC